MEYQHLHVVLLAVFFFPMALFTFTRYKAIYTLIDLLLLDYDVHKKLNYTLTIIFIETKFSNAKVQRKGKE